MESRLGHISKDAAGHKIWALPHQSINEQLVDLELVQWF
jgi:hypothetical protein